MKIRLNILYLILVALLSPSFDDVIDYKISLDRKDVRLGETFTVRADIKLKSGYHIYSVDETLTLSPSYFEWIDSSLIMYFGQMEEPKPNIKYDDFNKMDIGYHKGSLRLKQNLTIDKSIQLGKKNIEGTFVYQVCDSTKCIPHWDDFSLTINVESGSIRSQHDVSKENVGINSSLFGFFMLAFFAGLAALVTPCVFPMIPMTVAFFTGTDGKSKSYAIRDAFIFGISIIVIYSILGIGVSVIFGAEVANDLATSAIANIIFFLIFFLFALSFLGAFEITLPSSFVNKVNKSSSKGGIYGIFFMAFTLVLVSFSCTGPIVGTVLIESAQGELIKPIIGMLGFSLAFAIPFTFFAIFPDWLNNMPNSGGWLNSVKVVLGFLELALSLKFLSIADQTYHWGILDREIYLALWIVIFTLMGIYLLGIIRLPHDSKVEKLSVTRLMLSIATLSFVMYMIPGMFGAPLKSLSGYLPPMTTQDFKMQNNINSIKSDHPNVKYGDILHLPHSLKGFFDYSEALEYSKKVNKPLFIDFTGHGCVNCRKMEEFVWADQNVLSRLQNDYVIVALYVDDKTLLESDLWYTSEYDGKVKKTIGKQNFDFQIKRFNSNAQPYYVLLDHDEELLTTPKAYDLNIDNFVDFLDEGLDKFNR